MSQSIDGIVKPVFIYKAQVLLKGGGVFIMKQSISPSPVDVLFSRDTSNVLLKYFSSNDLFIPAHKCLFDKMVSGDVDFPIF